MIYTLSTPHFINVNLTKHMSNEIEYIAKTEKNSKIIGFTEPGVLYIKYSWASWLNPRRGNLVSSQAYGEPAEYSQVQKRLPGYR